LDFAPAARWSRRLPTDRSSGSVLRLGRSVYAVPAADEARLAAARVRGVVSHLSAALAHGWKVKVVPAVPHVTVARTRGRLNGDGVAPHWGNLSEGDLASGVMCPIRTVVDCARVLPFDEALAVADSALRSGKVRRAALMAAASTSPRTGRTAVLPVARTASAKSANPFESALRAIALDVPGLHAVPQGRRGIGRSR
jgi:hypothetical protein